MTMGSYKLRMGSMENKLTPHVKDKRNQNSMIKEASIKSKEEPEFHFEVLEYLDNPVLFSMDLL